MGPYLRKGGTFLTGFHSLVIPGVQSVEGVGETAVPGHLLFVGCEAGLGVGLVGRGRAVILPVGLLDHLGIRAGGRDSRHQGRAGMDVDLDRDDRGLVARLLHRRHEEPQHVRRLP